MKIIKFKCWNLDTKEWVADGEAMDLYYSARCNSFMFDNDNCDLPKNIIFLQFTGRKDKKDILIFEGDILEGIGVVEWVEKDCRFGINVLGELKEVEFWELEEKDLKVLGNRYSNPELLDHTKGEE